jgi:hypothetical protein
VVELRREAQVPIYYGMEVKPFDPVVRRRDLKYIMKSMGERPKAVSLPCRFTAVGLEGDTGAPYRAANFTIPTQAI